ncbi:Adenine deaminase [Cyphellophora attinorum]|uniref:Adenine deaminase n=1 Tax=Cyphellophora attinorum TaxID=1664694 RepID=A0A0N1NYY8_9EURO|nr:Adenine deaminase [Phialophora attinorum]KPI36786.1 Adenine deaminase [Phialophora attinorum]
MCKSPLHSLIAELPKCEHHLHLEGCLTPALLFQLAAKNNINLPSQDEYQSQEALEKRYSHFTNLSDFLQYYYRALTILITASDFEQLAWSYFQTAHHDGVQHAEVFFDPQSHTSRGVKLETVVEGFKAACERARREFGITSCLIMCFLRHLPLEDAAETMDEAVRGGYFEGGGDQGRIFTSVYAKAKELGVHRTAHAGEEGDPSYIAAALDSLGVERIDHGVRLAEDPALMRRVVAEGLLLTVCPLSNVCLQVVQKVGQLPIRDFLKAGVKFSINSDDPAYFGGYVLDNYCAVQEAFDLAIDEWRQIVTNSIECSWIKKERKSELMSNLNRVLDRYR